MKISYYLSDYLCITKSPKILLFSLKRSLLICIYCIKGKIWRNHQKTGQGQVDGQPDKNNSLLHWSLSGHEKVPTHCFASCHRCLFQLVSFLSGYDIKSFTFTGSFNVNQLNRHSRWFLDVSQDRINKKDDKRYE